MLLVLVNTAGGKQILEEIKAEGLDAVVMLPSVSDAVLYGVDNVIAGKLKEERIRQAINENSISAVIDALNDNESEASFAVSSICKELSIPLFKYLPFEQDYSGHLCVKFLDKVHDAADILNSDSQKTLMFGDAASIKKVAEWVLDKRQLYTAVLRGSELDVDFSLESCIPLANVIPSDSMEGIADISRIINLYGITRIVCYENLSVFNRISIAEETDAKIYIIRKEKPEYYTPIYSVSEIVDTVKAIEEELKQKAEMEKAKALEENAEIADEIGVIEEVSENIESMESTEDIEADAEISQEIEPETESDNEIQDAYDAESFAEEEKPKKVIYLHVQKPAEPMETDNSEDENLNSETSENNSEATDNTDETPNSESELTEESADESVADEQKVTDAENSEKYSENSEESLSDVKEYSVPKSKVVNQDGTINMDEFVKYVKQELNIDDKQ